MTTDSNWPFDMTDDDSADAIQSAECGLVGRGEAASRGHATLRSGNRHARGPKPPVWNGPEYRVYPPGIYDVRINKLQGPEWLKNHRRLSLRVECNFLFEEGEVSGFLNLGSDRENPCPGRQSNYFKVWCKANGGAPRRGQRMHWDDLLGKFFRVRIDTALKNSKGQPLSDAEQYSKIVEFLECIGP